jgi:hypothetical protein
MRCMREVAVERVVAAALELLHRAEEGSCASR